MNIHHLELFYYVARYGGISAAVRHMPYGIQQPALSSQIRLLEEDLGVSLFERTPFRLSPEGEELLAYVRPFFDNLGSVKMRLSKRVAPQVRIGASELVLRDYLPSVTQKVKLRHPDIRLGLRSGFQPELEAWLQNRQIDLAVLPLRGRPPASIRMLRLVRIPLVLVVHKRSKIKTAAELWTRPARPEPLITLPPTESISALFQKGLKARGVEWQPTTEASSIELITQYVANGHGIGVSIAVDDVTRHPLVRAIPLEGFDAMEMVAMWHGKPSPVIRSLLEEIQRFIATAWPAMQCADTIRGRDE
ncbi:MAG: LysR family transcriptional regulator [Opitutaceae bacterium]|nr:LysR family transcriptional regulator [Opitutaceae bacterium]